MRVPLAPLLVALAGCLGAAALGLTTYTLPLAGAASDPDLVLLLRTALHDSTGTLTQASRFLPIDSSPETDVHYWNPDSGTTDDAGSATTDLDAKWVTAAVAVQPAQVRAWLGHWVWSTAVTDGDTIRLTLRRFTLAGSCPLLSRLDAITVRSLSAATHLVRVTGTCPAMARPAP